VKKPAVHGKQETDYQFADRYYFCEGCEFKSKVIQGEKIIKYSCPARFDPYEPLENGRGCPKNIKFLEREKSKMEYGRGKNR